MQPMLAMIAELNRRQAELCKLLRRKDQEIMDYKDSGACLSRSKGYSCEITHFLLDFSFGVRRQLCALTLLFTPCHSFSLPGVTNREFLTVQRIDV